MKKDFPAACKLVLMRVELVAGLDGWARVDYEKLSDECSMLRRGVQRYLRQLIAAGVLQDRIIVDEKGKQRVEVKRANG